MMTAVERPNNGIEKDGFTNSINSWKRTSLDNDSPQLTLEKVHLQFDLENDVKKLLVQNNNMYIIQSSRIHRIDLENPSDVSRIAIPTSPQGAVITNSWLNPSGESLILQVNEVQYYHLHKSYKKAKVLSRLKGLQITWIALIGASDSHQTENLVFTTKDSHVHVASIKSHDPKLHDNKRDDKVVKRAYQLDGPLIGVAYCEAVARLYIFSQSEVCIWDCPESHLQSLLATFQQPPKQITVPKVGSMSVFTSSSHYYYLDAEKPQIYSNDWVSAEAPTEFYNLEEWEVSSAEQNQASTEYHVILLTEDTHKLVVISKLLPGESFVKDISSALGHDQVLGLTYDQVENTYWLFSSTNIYELIIKDDSSSAWYAYYKMGQYENALNALDANRNVQDLRSKKQLVAAKYGYELLQKGGFGVIFPRDDAGDFDAQVDLQLEGMRKLAQSREPFEKVLLMIMSLDAQTPSNSELEALMITYLEEKLRLTEDHVGNSVKSRILASWIVVVHLKQLKRLSSFNFNSNAAVYANKPREAFTSLDHSFESIKRKVFQFVEKHVVLVDKTFVYETIRKFNLSVQLVSIAEIFQDYDYAVKQYIELECWDEALTTLAKYSAAHPSDSKSLVYATSTVLLMNAPKSTTDLWLRLTDLNYERLLPAILFHNRRQAAAKSGADLSLRFMSKLIFEKNVTQSCISNYYISLLIISASKSDNMSAQKLIHKTLEYLRKSSSSQRSIPYDSNFVLRTCVRYEMYDLAIKILIEDLGLYEEALRLSLQKRSVSLAESVLQSFGSKSSTESDNNSHNEESDFAAVDDTVNASRIKLENEDFNFKRKLWLMYAEFLITTVAANETLEIPGLVLSSVSHAHSEDKLALISSNLSKILQYVFQISNGMNKNAGILSLKDLLPFLPESIMINQFKNEIVGSLNIYNNRINQLALEMQESATTAKKLRGQIADSVNQETKGFVSTIIEPGESCHLCEKLLVSKNFLIYPNCQHAYHKDCAVRYYLQSKSDYRFKKIFRNFKQFSSLSDKKELDILLTRECLLCNESLLNTLDDQLIDLALTTDGIFGT